jgi:ABC-type branched-subunit amino acid transport system permease subunit
MAYFLPQLINGIALGPIYGLIAIGYTMVYGIIGMINFAHGAIFMVGAFIAAYGKGLADETKKGDERGRQPGGHVRGVHRRREGLFGARLQAETSPRVLH